MLSRLLCLIISLIFMTSARADAASGIDHTEVTIGAFAEFVVATGFRTKALVRNPVATTNSAKAPIVTSV